MNNYVQIFWSARDQEEAGRIAKFLIQERWVACAQIMPIESLFLWQGKEMEAKEVLVIFKTRKEYFERVQQTIISQGSYEVPEILQVHIEKGNPAYLEWLDKVLSREG